MGWWDLSSLAEHDPDQALAVWEQVKVEARKELETGHWAAKALDWNSGPWERAQFLALRSSFREEWRPQGGIEGALVDTMAQAQVTYLFWLERLWPLSTTEGEEQDRAVERKGYWVPPRVTTAQAADQAAAMVDRFNRLVLRTLRALRDLRRYAPSVVVQNAGQVNIGERQVNISSQGAQGAR